MNTTNVSVNDLNYNSYENDIYDEDIQRSIPGYNELHESIVKFISKYKTKYKLEKILELGIGTGITAEKYLEVASDASLVAIDFSKQMMEGAKIKLKSRHVNYILADYSELDFETNFDMVISVISIHHQSDIGKKILFEKIYNSLSQDGIFVFGDIVTSIDKHNAAYNDAMHFHYLVENARNNKSLEEWAYHHRFLNIPSPIETQLEWLKQLKFKNIKVLFERFNTALIVAQK